VSNLSPRMNDGVCLYSFSLPRLVNNFPFTRIRSSLIILRDRSPPCPRNSASRPYLLRNLCIVSRQLPWGHRSGQEIPAEPQSRADGSVGRAMTDFFRLGSSDTPKKKHETHTNPQTPVPMERWRCFRSLIPSSTPHGKGKKKSNLIIIGSMFRP